MWESEISQVDPNRVRWIFEMLLERDKEVEEEDEEEGDKDGEQDKIRRQATLLSRKGKGAFRESSYLRVLNKTLQQNTKVGFAHKFKYFFTFLNNSLDFLVPGPLVGQPGLPRNPATHRPQVSFTKKIKKNLQRYFFFQI